MCVGLYIHLFSNWQLQRHPVISSVFFLFSQPSQPNPSLTLELQNSEAEKQSSNIVELKTKSLIKLLISHSIKAKILFHMELDFLMWTGVR